MTSEKKILVYGYGNPGRQDDGLGNAIVEHIDNWISKNKATNIATDSNYQLNIEDASTISDKDIVVFADASVEDISDFCLSEIKPSAKVDFTMHSVTPAFVVNLCQEIYGRIPESYLLHIKGYEWEFQEGITGKAKENLSRALDFLLERLMEPSLFKESLQECI